MKNKLFSAVFITVAVITTAIVLISCQRENRADDNRQHNLKVVTTLFPLYDMAKNIGTGKVDVLLLLPPGVEPHSFEPKPSDVVRINEADIFVYTGRFMEPWAEDIVKSVTNKNLVVVDASRGTKMIPGVFHDADEPAGSLDPHIWLDFDNAKIMAGNIEQAFEIKDADNRNFYRQQAEKYTKKLDEIEHEYKKALATCRKREIIYAGHYAFGYLAKRYGLKYMAAQGISPDSEPTAGDLSKLIEQIRKDKIKYIFYEELTSPKIAETIAEETNTKMLLLNAAHNITRDQLEHGDSFFDILQGNLDNLRIGLECR